ncbi:MAG: DUF3160 domain-containing protein [Chromatiales bacterium]|nr:DUF3160 domain-containing protein [Chromatiales bacterium]
MRACICRTVPGSVGALIALLFAAALPAVEPQAPPSGFFDLYEDNRRQGIANLITEDFLLLGYGLIRQRTIEEMEVERLRPLFGDILAKLAAGLDGLATESPAKQSNRRYIAILQALLSGDESVLIDDVARAEYQAVVTAAGIAVSPLWQRRVDYSQFRPRGRYTATEEFERYFRAIRYAGDVLFAVKASRATGLDESDVLRLTAQALQLSRLIHADASLAVALDEIERLLTWSFGPSEDLRSSELLAVARHCGKAKDCLPSALLEFARAHGRQPVILSGLVDESGLEPGVSPADVLTGWRLLPSRFSANGAAMQSLVYADTGEYQGPPDVHPLSLSVIGGRKVKGYPTALEMLALLGDDLAAARVRERGDASFAGYGEAMKRARSAMFGTQGLDLGQTVFLSALLKDGTRSSEARQRSALGFWVWQRYLAVLYAKQSYTLMGKGLIPDTGRDGADLVPATALYQALGGLARAHAEAESLPVWREFAEVLDRISEISLKRDLDLKPSPSDEAFLNRLDKILLALTQSRDTPIVVDVHSNPADGMVLQEALAWPRVVRAGSATGAVFEHREFKQPMDERLTDEQWQAILERDWKQARTGKRATSGVAL